jgi:hypothetical protein
MSKKSWAVETSDLWSSSSCFGPISGKNRKVIQQNSIIHLLQKSVQMSSCGLLVSYFVTELEQIFLVLSTFFYVMYSILKFVVAVFCFF